MRAAPCHPERKHYARGMCKPCWRRANLDLMLARERRYHVKHRDKRNVVSRAWRAANPERVRANMLAWSAAHRVERAAYDKERQLLLQAFADAERVRGCVDCGEKDMRVIDMDHIPERGPKLFNIARPRTTVVSRFLAELDKCEPRCKTCHRKITRERKLDRAA